MRMSTGSVRVFSPVGLRRVSRRSQVLSSRITVRNTVRDSEQTETTSSVPDRSPAYKAQFGVVEEKSPKTETTSRSSSESSSQRWSSSDFSKMAEATREAFDQFVNRYDFVSTAAGSMLVTSYCVYKGQCPATALMIAATATVTALGKRKKKKKKRSFVYFYSYKYSFTNLSPFLCSFK